MGTRYSAVALGRRFWTGPETDRDAVGQSPPSRKYVQAGEHWLARAVGHADTLLRRCHGVREFTTKRTCLFRIAVRHATHGANLSDGSTISPGDPIIELHLWNEHFLRIPPGGADFTWAKVMRRRFQDSLGDLAIHVDECGALESAVAVCGCGGIAYDGNGGKIIRFMEKFGFEAFPCQQRHGIGRMIDFFCDFWVFLLVCAFNPRSARTDLLFRRRCELWISREMLSRKFGRLGERT